MQVICRLDDISSTSGKEVCVEFEGGEVWLMLFVRDGEVLAYYNNCPHQGRALNLGPDRFMFGQDGRLICPHHGACFELTTGLCTSGPCEGRFLRSVQTRLMDGDVHVNLRATQTE